MTRAIITYPKKKINKRPGRLGVWNDTIPERAYQLCAVLGARNEDLATAFGVNKTSIEGWLRDRPEFKERVEQGKEDFDTHNVEKTLLMRALGYEYDEVAEFNGVNTKGQDYSYTRTTKKKVLPDITAIIFWLKNRNRAKWSDVMEHYHNGTINFKKIDEMPLDKFSEEEQKLLFEIGMKQLTDGTSSN